MYAVAMPVTALVTPGPEVTSATPTLSARARVAVGRVHRALLVAHQHVLDLVLLEQLVVDVEHRAARIAEDVLDAFFLEAADDDFRTRELHGCALYVVGSCHPARARARVRDIRKTALARVGVARAHQGFDRVESRDSENTGRAPRDSPATLVASPEGSRTAVFAVQHRPVSRPGSLDLAGRIGQVARCKQRFCGCTIGCRVQHARPGRQFRLPRSPYNLPALRPTDPLIWPRLRKFRRFSRKSSAAPSSRRCSPCATRMRRSTSCRTRCSS